MKKLRIIFTIALLLSISLFSKDVFALSSDALISVGTGYHKVTVTTNTKVPEIEKILGKAKIETPSAFGGTAYTFYTDDNYSNYLYIETTSDGTIASFGSVDPTYQTNTYSYNSKYNYRENGVLHGCLINVDGYIKGGIYYNKYNIFDGSYKQTVNTYVENYQSDENKYLRSLVEHSVTMFNALSANLGNKTNLVFDEDFFYINQQFKQNGSSMREYFEKMDKANYYHGIKVRENIEFTNSIYYIMNPAIIASLCTYSLNTDFGDQNIAIFDYNQETKLITAATVAKNAFDRYDPVELTSEEKIKLSSGKQEYKKAIDDLNAESEMFDIIPQTKVAGSLVAGKLKYSKRRGILEYVNAIRLAAGLHKYKLDENAYDISQHIATLSSYRVTELHEEIRHAPPQPAGVTNTFYKRALSMNEGYSENIGYSQTEMTPEVMMYHINMFLDDSNERPQNYSHRIKIIDTKYTDFGYGISNFTYANEMKGNNLSDNPIIAWPSKGITFLESLVYKKFSWTAQFVKRYTIQNNTTVTVKCLNTNNTWNFTDEVETSSKKFKRVTNDISTLNNKVVFFDSNIVPEAGYVYEITLHNIYDEEVGRVIDYTYRSVFENADDNNNPTTLTNLKIISPYNSPKVEGEKYVYYVPIEEAVDFDVEIDSSVVDKKVTWYSSNPEVVSVTQNGLVTANKLWNDDITITVSYDGSDVTDQILVRPYSKLEQVQLEAVEHNFSSIDKGTYKDLYIKYVPDTATEQTSIKWKVITETNATKEYDIDDPEITEYIIVEPISEDKKTVRIHAVDAHTNNNAYKIRAHVQGILYEYTGTYDFKVNVKLDEIRISKSFDCATYSYDAEKKLSTINIDYKSFIANYPNGVFKLDLEYFPVNTTVERDVKWQVSNSNILDEYTAGGEYKIVGDKSVTVTATHGLNESTQLSEGDSGVHVATAVINIDAPLEDMRITGDNLVAIKDDGNGNMTGTTQLNVVKTPIVNSDKVEFSSSNNDVAEVSDTGLVRFKKQGNVTITAKSNNITRTFNCMSIVQVTGLSYIDTQPLLLRKGQVVQKDVVISPSEAQALRNKIVYSSTRPDVASVDTNGRITAKNPGTCTIVATIDGKYATSNSVSASIKVEVYEPVEDIILNKTDFKLHVDKTNTDNVVKYTISPNTYSEKVHIDWINETPELLTFNDYNGKITPLKSGVGSIRMVATISNAQSSRKIEKKIIVYIYKNGQLAYLKGDMDKNMIINGTDASIAMDKYNRNKVTAEDLLIGDMDGNGILNGTDASMILDIYNKAK